MTDDELQRPADVDDDENDRQLRDAAARYGRPHWLVDRDDDDGIEGLTMLGHGLDDE